MKYTREIPVYGAYDVIVAGSGPAGVSAAIAAGREVCKTLLVERFGVLGGNLTGGHISPILGAVSGGTFYDELIKRLEERNPGFEHHRTRNGKEIGLDHETAKDILTALVHEAGVEVMLCAAVVDAVKEENRVTGLIVTTPGGLFCVKANVVIDATGDGCVASLAGAECAVGREDGGLQPMTLEFCIDQVDETRAISAWGGSDPVKLPDGKEYRVLCREKEAAGELPKNVSIVRLHRTAYPGRRSVNATQVNGLNPLDSCELGQAETVLRAQISSIMKFLHTYVPGYENARIISSPSSVGVRESRRVVGDYILCDHDIETGARFDDAVVHEAWFLIDIHNPKGGGQAEGFAQPAVPYDIPYRCFLPKGLEQIMTAGRCISGTHRAHASYRVMAICMAMGEAVGVAASIAVKSGRTPREVPAEEVREALRKKGVDLG